MEAPDYYPFTRDDLSFPKYILSSLVPNVSALHFPSAGLASLSPPLLLVKFWYTAEMKRYLSF